MDSVLIHGIREPTPKLSGRSSIVNVVRGYLNTFHSKLRCPTLIEALVLVVFAVILVALFVPGTQWASSGTIRFPVRVFVFDVEQQLPISGANVAIFRALPTVSPESLSDPDQGLRQYRADNAGPLHYVARGTTNADGACVIEYEFRTGASHHRPARHAHTNWSWVEIKAEGFSTVVVPVRHVSMPTKVMREQTDLYVPIGLARK